MKFSDSGNNSWLFQKAYYTDFIWTKKEDEPYAPTFFKQQLNYLKHTALIFNDNPAVSHTINLVTMYPGLATGVGVTHESKSKAELKLGFEFDYSEGMPVIRGHSVKGALRAAFPQYDVNGKRTKYKVEKAYQLYCWLNSKEITLEEFNMFKEDKAAIDRIRAVEREIFDGIKKDGKLLSVYQQDIFFDAFIIKPSNHITTMNQYLGSDSITPHKDNPFKNPIPIPFLKVLPGVTFEFRFQLNDNGLLTVEQKKMLFQKILMENGIGAKTNVGYGKFVEVIAPTKGARQQIKAAMPVEKDEIPSKLFFQLKNNAVFDGVIQRVSETHVVCIFAVGNESMKIVKKLEKIEGDLQQGKKVTLVVKADYNPSINLTLNCKIKVSS